MARTCPDCGSDLKAEDILGITLDVCPECAGIWFDDGELLKLKELGDDAMSEVEDEFEPGKAESPTKKESSRMCPDCKTGMEEFAYLYTTSVNLDSCPKCNGTWVDNGELQAMREALDTARSTPENTSLMRTLKHQIKIIEGMDVHNETLERHALVHRVLRVFGMQRRTVG